jgi:hypothetical protein
MCNYSLSGVSQDAAFVVSSTHYMLLDLKVTRVFFVPCVSKYQQHDLMPISDYTGFPAVVLLLSIIHLVVMFVCCLFSWRYKPLCLYFRSPVAGFSLLVFEVS